MVGKERERRGSFLLSAAPLRHSLGIVALMSVEPFFCDLFY